MIHHNGRILWNRVPNIMPHQTIDVTSSLVPVDVTFSLSGTFSPWEATSRDNKRLMEPLDVDLLHTFSDELAPFHLRVPAGRDRCYYLSMM